MKDKLYTVISVLLLLCFVALGAYFITTSKNTVTVTPTIDEMVSEGEYATCETELVKLKTTNEDLKEELENAKTILDNSICFDKHF